MRDPASFFAVQKFAMQDKDILYISNHDSVELIKFLDIVNTVSSQHPAYRPMSWRPATRFGKLRIDRRLRISSEVKP